MKGEPVEVSPFVLIHSPHVGPLTWQLVANVLRARGIAVVTPILSHAEEDSTPYWERHAEEVVAAIEASGVSEPPVLVGHAGAGPLLPSVRPSIEGDVRGYVFVDSNIPRDGASRLDLLGDDRAATLFRAAASDRLLLTWSYEELREVIPDDSLRRQFVEELVPIPLPVYEEALPVFEAWPDAPCAYLRLSSVYSGAADEARGWNWPTMELQADHYHMLVDPEGVADALVELVKRWDGRREVRRPAARKWTPEQALETMLGAFRRLKR
jgi:hypothetical protein